MTFVHFGGHLPREVAFGSSAYQAAALVLVNEEGREVVLEEGDTASASEFFPDGTPITGGGLSVTVTPGSAAIGLAWDVSNTALYRLKEGYRARVTIEAASALRTFVREVFFDVVRQPFVPTISVAQFPPHLTHAASEGDFARILQIAFTEFSAWLRATVRLDQRMGDAWRAYYATPSPRGFLARGAREERHRPALVMSIADANECVRHWALKLAYREAMLRAGDVWAAQLEMAAADLEEAKRRLLATMRYDADETGAFAKADDAALYGPMGVMRR